MTVLEAYREHTANRGVDPRFKLGCYQMGVRWRSKFHHGSPVSMSKLFSTFETSRHHVPQPRLRLLDVPVFQPGRDAHRLAPGSLSAAGPSAARGWSWWKRRRSSREGRNLVRVTARHLGDDACRGVQADRQIPQAARSGRRRSSLPMPGGKASTVSKHGPAAGRSAWTPAAGSTAAPSRHPIRRRASPAAGNDLGRH